MRKMAAALTMVMAIAAAAYGSGDTLLDARERFVKESTEVKALIQASKDALVVNSMYDACVVTVTQLDAYFYMLGIFDTIPKEAVSQSAVDYLLQWLAGVKQANRVSVGSLDAIVYDVSVETAGHIKKMKEYYTDLNAKIDGEIDKLGIIGRAASAGKPAGASAGKKTK